MNKILLCLLLSFYLYDDVVAKEVRLVCNGSYFSVSSGDKSGEISKPTNLNVVLTFDDTKRVVLSVTPSVAAACVDNPLVTARKCDCKVTDTRIRCDSEYSFGDSPIINSQSFSIDRHTKIMEKHDVINNGTPTRLIGKLSCEVSSRAF